MRIAVIGAGASGLPAIKSALEENCEVICYEMASDIGGLWNYKPDPCPGEGSVMKSTVINTSKEMTSYSDFPAPSLQVSPTLAEYANYMHNSQLLKYFQMYAEHTNNTTIELFDGVMVCTGHHTHEYWPQPWEGQNLFKGKIMHSHEYKDHRTEHFKGFEDKVVVVVGVGNSGCDIAVELSKISSQKVYPVFTQHKLNRPIEFFHRKRNQLKLAGSSYMLSTVILAAFAFKKIIPWKVLCSAMEKKVNGRQDYHWKPINYSFIDRFDHGRFGLKPDHRILAAHVTINDELPNRIASGTVQIKPNIASFTEHGVVFDDDTIVEHVDIVILATGYSFGFPIVEDGRLIEVKENRANLYKYMYPPELSDKARLILFHQMKMDLNLQNSLAVIGLIQPTGSILPLSEMQTRLFMSVLKGRTKIPNQVNMIKDIESKRRQMEREFVASRRHTIQVYYPSYMDELAELYGCKPKIFRRCFTDPMLAYHLIFYGLVPYQYRLDVSFHRTRIKNFD
ncbi:hypothetical protein WR25_01004 isoform B [Diploscapter pachys]|uniref:Flavin-containing monooxygenase n=1 Tax=Diploscapter pachys TaxID=2018661 RepID=A0A2A2LGN4_9BILA|nr:hypothetical protein WR25_01004 isoform B [Diploscapter pachys]